MAALTRSQIRELVRAFGDSRWTRLILELPGTRIVADKRGRPPVVDDAPPAPQPAAAASPPEAPPVVVASSPEAPPAPAAAAPVERDGDVVAVESPAVGVFWRSPSPGAPPFIEVGQEVERDQQVGIVEVMKLMNQVLAPVAGEVVAISAENAAMVEYGQELLLIRPSER